LTPIDDYVAFHTEAELQATRFSLVQSLIRHWAWWLMSAIALLLLTVLLAWVIPFLRHVAAINTIRRNDGVVDFDRHAPVWLRDLVSFECERAFARDFDVHFYNEWKPDHLQPLRAICRLRCVRLHHYHNWDNPGPSDDFDLSCLPELSTLEELHLWDMSVGDRTLEQVTRQRNLKALRIYNNWGTITDAGYAHLKKLPRLEVFEINDCTDQARITDVGLSHIVPLSKLRSLQLNFSNVSETALASLASLSRLESLVLSHAPITPNVASALSRLTSLKKLHLYESTLTDVGLERLAALPNIEDVSLSNSKITGAGLSRCSSWPLKKLDLSSLDVYDDDLACLTAWPALEKLDLSWTQITSRGLEHLKSLVILEELRLRGTHLDDAGMTNLVGLTRLSELFISDTCVGDSGVAHLSRLIRMQRLHLDSTEVTDAALIHLRDMAELRELGLWGTHVTSAGLPRLIGFRNLWQMWLEQNPNLDVGVADLQRHRPSIHIHRYD